MHGAWLPKTQFHSCCDLAAATFLLHGSPTATGTVQLLGAAAARTKELEGAKATAHTLQQEVNALRCAWGSNMCVASTVPGTC